MTLLNLLLSILIFSVPKSILAQKTIHASGGGIVKPGDHVVLTYDLGAEEWERCFWSFNGSSCSYDLDAATGSAAQHKCKPTSFGDFVTYTGKKSTECQITVKKIDQDHIGTWSAKVDEEETSTKVEVRVAKPAKSAEIRIGEEGSNNTVRSGERSKVSCDVHGGIPAPSVSLKIDGLAKILNDSQTQNLDNVTGEYETVQSVWFNATREDHGRVVTCQATPFDKDGKAMFEPVHAENATLNVTFPPNKHQENENVIFRGRAGGSANVSIVFEANPWPESVKWVVDSEELLDLPTSKYDSLPLVSSSQGGIKYTAILTIKKLEEADEDKKYRLEVSNSAGMQAYNFTLIVISKGEEEAVPTTTARISTTTVTGSTTTTMEGESTTTEKGGPGEDGGSSAGLVFGILAAIVIIGVAIASIYVYRMRQNSSTVPLSSSEVR